MPENGKRRALILAGGGVKVAFQAGVLQVWMDEAGLDFDLADGASGGCFNLAMWVQGMSGRQIADNWRNLDPRAGVDFNWSQYLRLFYAESLFELGAYREKVFPAWGLDFEKIRNSPKEATFNVYNFSKHELAVITPDHMSEDFLVACVSLPMWFPPVHIGGDTYIDSVFNTDANLEEAIRRGADELWVIWTVSLQGEWRNGFVANYFQVIETAANGRYKQVLLRIEENNRAIAAGGHGEFGRPIEVKELRAEVPLHYLVNFNRDRSAEAVNRGVEAAREWCREMGIPLRNPGPDYAMEVHTAATSLQFTEDMKGYVALGETDFQRGFDAGRGQGTFLHCHLTIQVDGVNRFITHPDHQARITGAVRCATLGGDRPVESGVFNLFVDADDPTRKRMLYRIHFRDGGGQPLTLSGHKMIEDDPGLDAWSDTTTLFVRIYRGHIGADQEGNTEVVAAGIIRIQMLDFLKQLTTFRVEAPTVADRAAALGRFGQLFLGQLWDVYAREVLSSGPV
ncbi:MAG TPA: patatin-like phospholipase family protein [Thermoanaerobaculia bacterium]